MPRSQVALRREANQKRRVIDDDDGQDLPPPSKVQALSRRKTPQTQSPRTPTTRRGSQVPSSRASSRVSSQRSSRRGGTQAPPASQRTSPLARAVPDPAVDDEQYDDFAEIFSEPIPRPKKTRQRDGISDTSDTSSSFSFSDGFMTLPLASSTRKPRGLNTIPRFYKHVAMSAKGLMEYFSLMKNPFPSAEEMSNHVENAWAEACRRIGIREVDQVAILPEAAAYVRFPYCLAVSHADTSVMAAAPLMPLFQERSFGACCEGADP